MGGSEIEVSRIGGHKGLNDKPIILDYYCVECKEKLSRGEHIELREYEFDDKHQWHRVCCTHLLKVYKEERLSDATGREAIKG